MTNLVCVSEVSVQPPPHPTPNPHRQLHTSSQYKPIMIYAVLTSIHMTYTEYDVITSHI